MLLSVPSDTCDTVFASIYLSDWQNIATPSTPPPIRRRGTAHSCVKCPCGSSESAKHDCSQPLLMTAVATAGNDFLSLQFWPGHHRIGGIFFGATKWNSFATSTSNKVARRVAVHDFFANYRDVWTEQCLLVEKGKIEKHMPHITAEAFINISKLRGSNISVDSVDNSDQQFVVVPSLKMLRMCIDSTAMCTESSYPQLFEHQWKVERRSAELVVVSHFSLVGIFSFAFIGSSTLCVDSSSRTTRTWANQCPVDVHLRFAKFSLSVCVLIRP